MIHLLHRSLPVLISIDELYGHLLAHEMHLEQQIPVLDIQQPTTNFSPRAPMQRGRGYCGYGGQPYNRGHGSFSNNRGRGSYFSPDAASSSWPTCQICGKPGHIALHCYHRQDLSLSK
jgi:hypothetical protein